MDFVKKALALLFGWWMFAVTLQAPCNNNIKPRKALKRLRRRYLFVEKDIPDYGTKTIKQEEIGRRTRRDIDTSLNHGGKNCKWYMEIEDSSRDGLIQKPRFVSKAVCPRCQDHCAPVQYTIRVLVKKGCDKKTGEVTWTWVDKTIPVAYVYNPWAIRTAP